MKINHSFGSEPCAHDRYVRDFPWRYVFVDIFESKKLKIIRFYKRPDWSKLIVIGGKFLKKLWCCVGGRAWQVI